MMTFFVNNLVVQVLDFDMQGVDLHSLGADFSVQLVDLLLQN